jgi:Domain of unknown function (DUF4954)
MGGIGRMGEESKLERLSAKVDRVLAKPVLATSVLEGAAQTRSALVSSLRKIAQEPSRFEAGRPLSSEERAQLENQGNVCSDWSKIRLLSNAGLDSIRNNCFGGDVLLSGFKGEWPGSDGRTWSAGMANCRVRDAVIGNACLYDITRLERQIIEDGAIILGVRELDCPAPTLFSLGQAIHPGTETGARSVWIWDELTLEDCMDMLSLTAEAQGAFHKKLDSALASLRCDFGFVGAGAMLMHAQQIHSAWIGPGTRISDALLIRESALISTPESPCLVAQGSLIEHSLLQPGAHVESSGKVSHSVLLEHSAVSWAGMVSQSVIGHNTWVQKGEITASLVGPSVGFHHQALLISAIWPEGRGNIAYGANVGSNHTGRKPDQEIRPGEGNFFGLGCSIKFPANYEESPYSIFATGITTLPQRLSFPFSLITQPQTSFPELGPAINEIIPGWMWSDNAYALVRRSYKFETANLGQLATSTLRSGFFTGRIFMPQLAHMVLKASQSLRAAPADLPYYLESHIPGLGKNFLRGKVRERALAAYNDYLCFFLMRTYADLPQKDWTREVQNLVGAISKELIGDLDIEVFLAKQKFWIPTLKANILRSLQRDDERGSQIFDDYTDFHAPPEADGAIKRLNGDLDQLAEKVDRFLQTK